MDQKTVDRVKQGVVMILIAAVFSVVPFYFQTSAATVQLQQTNSTQDTEIGETKTRIQQLELRGAVNETETKQIKESLDRIEKKIDRLIEEQQ
jgi:hypothetical protein